MVWYGMPCYGMARHGMACIYYIARKLLCLTYLLGPGAPGGNFCGDKGGARGGVYMWLQKCLAFLGRGIVVSKPVLQWTFSYFFESYSLFWGQVYPQDIFG